jgi:hypothetical protein
MRKARKGMKDTVGKMAPLHAIKSPSLGGMGKMPKMSMPKKSRGSTVDVKMLKNTPYRD